MYNVRCNQICKKSSSSGPLKATAGQLKFREKAISVKIASF